MTQYQYCRVCNRGHSLNIESLEDGTTQVHGIPADPLSLGTICTASAHASKARLHPKRFKQPQKKHNGSWVSVSWEEAISEIGATLSSLRKDKGAKSLGLGLGHEPMTRSIDFVRSMAFGASRGFGHIFSTLSEETGPQRMMAEWMIGHPCVPLSDLSRAHNIIVLGSDPREAGWNQLGTWYEAAIQHSRKTKKTIVSSLCSNKGAFSKSIDQQLPIRPGTEPFFLLGMLHIIIKRGWADKQYLHDHTMGLSEVQAYVDQWTLERCAKICGLEDVQFSGLCLKFARAAMGVVHLGPGALNNHNSALAAWAWMAVHMVTANALRPGGNYENLGAFDLYPALASLLMNDAPQGTKEIPPPLLMQTSFGFLPQAELSGLVLMGSIPESVLRPSMKKSLQNLDVLIVGARQPSWLTEQADWVLPITHPFEENDVCVHRNPELPSMSLPRSNAIFPPYEQSKSIDQILSALSSSFSASWKGPWGYHLNLAARPLCTMDLELWLERLLDFGQTAPLPREPGLRYQGESDRSLWRPEKDAIQFPIPILKNLFKNVVIPQTSEQNPFLLHTSGSVDDALDNAHREAELEAYASVHPDSNIKEGEYILETQYGSITVSIRHDESLRNDVVRAPYCRIPQIMNILPDMVSPYTGTAILDGIACNLRAVT